MDVWQASYITGGVYLKPQQLDGLFQYLSVGWELNWVLLYIDILMLWFRTCLLCCLLTIVISLTKSTWLKEYFIVDINLFGSVLSIYSMIIYISVVHCNISSNNLLYCFEFWSLTCFGCLVLCHFFWLSNICQPSYSCDLTCWC